MMKTWTDCLAPEIYKSKTVEQTTVSIRPYTMLVILVTNGTSSPAGVYEGISKEDIMMKRSMVNIILPGDTPLYLFTIKAIMSVPPVLPPWDIHIPMPAPAIIPPIMVDISLPLSMART